MKIAMVGPAHPFKGGIAHYTTLLYRQLRVSHEVRFYSFSRPYPRWFFAGKNESLPDPLFQLNGEVLRTLHPLRPSTWFKTAKALRAYEPDILLMPWWVLFWAPLFYVLARQTKKGSRTRIVFICHNVLPHEKSLWQKPVTRSVLGLADAWIVHSEEDRQRLVSILPKARAHKIMHPLYDVFHKNVDRAEARKKLGWEGFVLLFFGFVRPYKGLRYLLEAMPQAVRQTGARLIVAGEFWEDIGKYRSQIRHLEIEKHVTMIDRYIPSEDVHDYFCAADAVVLPYVHGTGSGVAQLALGCRRPVIASNVGSLTEVVAHGKNGLLVPPGDPGALAKAITDFYHNPLQVSPADCSRFSWDHLTHRIESLVGS